MNAKLDVEIAKGEDAVERLTARADNLQDENDQRRRDNAAMRERIRLMREQLAEMKK
jgi:hypothetical protein